MAGLGRDHRGQNAGLTVEHTVEPSDALEQILAQNIQLKASLADSEGVIQKLMEQAGAKDALLVKLRPFQGIAEDPMAKLDVPISDKMMVMQLRKRMIQTWGRAGDIDSDGKWVQTAAYTKFTLMINELLREGLRRWVHVVPKIRLAEGVGPDAEPVEQV